MAPVDIKQRYSLYVPKPLARLNLGDWQRRDLQSPKFGYAGVSIQTDSTELRRTQDELEVAMVHAEAANEAKTQFLATVSHEMRTPLNAILGSAELALTEDGVPPVVHEHLARIDSAGEALLQLITDVLDVSKIEAGEIDVERVPFDLRATLEGAVAPIRARAEGKGLEFELVVEDALPATILGDPGRLRQIVTNLAENAVRHSSPDEEVLVRVSTEGNDVKMEVIDHGAGIAPEHLPRLFERFYRVDKARSRQFGGAGLGLAIVKTFVEAHGGRVEVKSEIGAGSTFTVRLPRATSVAQP